MSPIPGILRGHFKIPPINSPIPDKNSPHATKNQTVIGSPNDSASEIFNGNFENPCNIKTIERGNLIKKLAPLKSGIFF